MYNAGHDNHGPVHNALCDNHSQDHQHGIDFVMNISDGDSVKKSPFFKVLMMISSISTAVHCLHLQYSQRNLSVKNPGYPIGLGDNGSVTESVAEPCAFAITTMQLLV